MSINMFDLTGKVAVITGGNSGLGLAYARGLAKSGADVVLWGRNREKNQQAVAALEAFGGRVWSQEVDVSSDTAVAEAMAAAVEKMGRLDCVVANAGIASQTGGIDQMTTEMYHELLNINLHGAMYTLREGAKHMIARAKAGEPGGSFIICGSMSIFYGVPGLAHYAAAKGALNSVAKTMAAELGPYQIRVNVIAPGFIATEMTQADPEVFKQIDAAVSARTPMGRSGVPEDLEGAAVYLASDLSSYHTGDTLIIDGGRYIS
ncbi:MAG: 2-deoxy-D-gluconate 3-dehydrogenase [Porticoccaceae bacterium]|nr:2-deoxy-D-gluconate 3-dehydrogenase [Porticoccaceae bacterium]